MRKPRGRPVDDATQDRIDGKETSRDRMLTDHELILFWKARKGYDYPRRHFLRTLLLTAERRSEVATMRQPRGRPVDAVDDATWDRIEEIYELSDDAIRDRIAEIEKLAGDIMSEYWRGPRDLQAEVDALREEESCRSQDALRKEESRRSHMMRRPRGRPPSPGRPDLDHEIIQALFWEWWKSGNRSGGIRRAARQLAKELAERQPPLHISPARLRSRFYEIVKDLEIDDLRRSKRKLVR